MPFYKNRMLLIWIWKPQKINHTRRKGKWLDPYIYIYIYIFRLCSFQYTRKFSAEKFIFYVSFVCLSIQEEKETEDFSSFLQVGCVVRTESQRLYVIILVGKEDFCSYFVVAEGIYLFRWSALIYPTLHLQRARWNFKQSTLGMNSECSFCKPVGLWLSFFWLHFRNENLLAPHQILSNKKSI